MNTRMFRNPTSPAGSIALSTLCILALCSPVRAESSKILTPTAGAVVTKTPLKITIEARGGEAKSFGVTINGQAIEQLFTKVQGGESSALLRRHNLRVGPNRLTVRYADHETSSIQFTYAPHVAAGLPGGDESTSASSDYIPIHTRLVGGAGMNPGDYSTEVGSTRYVAPDGNGVTGFHVVGLDRGNAELKFNIVVPGDSTEFPYIAQQIRQQAAANCTGPWGCILIVSSMQTIGPTPCPAFPNARCSSLLDPGASMASLGGTFRMNFVDGTKATNSYSMITTIGQNGHSPRGQGQADERLACESSSGCLIDYDAPNAWTGYGDISGALVGDNNNALTFTPVSRPTFSLRASPNAGDVNTITVNGQQYSGSLNGASGGFHVLILDASRLNEENLAGLNYTFPATAWGLSLLVQSVGAYLTGPGATQNILVFVASMGDLGHSGAGSQWLQVAQVFSNLGGTYHLVAGLKSGDDYAMVGAPATESMWRPIQPAAESSSVVTRYASNVNPLPPTQLLGYLKKNHFGYYRPGLAGMQYDTENASFTEATTNIENALLDKVALTAPISWPICNVCTATDGSNPQINAYQAISYNLTVLGAGTGNPDIRSDYTQDDINSAVWSQYQSNVTSLTPAALRTWLAAHEPNKPYLANFSDADFAVVQNQLGTELGYMVLLTEYEKHVAHAVNNSKTNLESEIGTMYDELASELQINTQSQSNTDVNVMDAIAGALSIASYATPEAPAFALALDAFSVTLSYSASLTNDQNGVPIVADQLRSTVATLKNDTNTSFTSTVEVLKAMFSLIYQDWGRMQVLGNALGNNPTPAINWQLDTGNSYVNYTAKSMGRQFLGAFFSTLYNVYNWYDFSSGAPPANTALAVCNADGISSGDCPLGAHYAPLDWLNLRDRPNGQNPSSNNDGNYWDVLLISGKGTTFHGHLSNCTFNYCVCDQQIQNGAYPLEDVMQEIFAPIGTYELAHNLGVYPPWLFTRYGIPQQSFFPHTGCTSD